MLNVYIFACYMLLSCFACSWWDTRDCDSEVPKLGLIFFHMRKAGGTHILHLIEEWLKNRKCLNTPEVLTHHGVNKGEIDFYLDGYTAPQSLRCPHVDVVHIEFGCLAMQAIDTIPRRNERQFSQLSLFTSFRHPLQRIISQAYYERGLGSFYIRRQIQRSCESGYDDRVLSNCLKGGSFASTNHPDCGCYVATYNEARHTLRTNTTMWYEWFKLKGVGDMYMDNYYIKRLVTLEPAIPANTTLTQINKKCITKDTESSMNTSNLRVRAPNAGMNPTKRDCEHLDGFALLQNISSHAHCRYPKRASEYDVALALQRAKYYLDHVFDFIILEHIHEEATKAVFEKLFFEEEQSLHIHRVDNKSTNSFHNDTTVTNNSTLYIPTEYMPQEIVDFLLVDNKEDIELYNYAVELFYDRYSL